MRTLILKLAFEQRREAREPHQMLREEEEEGGKGYKEQRRGGERN